MLRGLDPLLSPDLLHTLAMMGHGDEIVIADANFPAYGVCDRVVRLDGITATDTLAAVLSVMPLDSFIDNAAITMQVVGDTDAVPEIVATFQTIIDETADHPSRITSLERFAFYDRARGAFAVIQTGERRLYGNIILSKGVVAP